MTLDPTTLGRRLREARENRRLTQEQAAQEIGISRTALVHIEAGKRSLSTLELGQLAKLYHRTVGDFFAEEGTQEVRGEDPLVMLHRLPTELRDNPDIKYQIHKCVELCAIGVELEQMLGIEESMSLPAYELRAPTKAFEATRQGERVADEERRRLGLGYGPIADVSELISTQGVWATGVRGLPTEMSGIFMRHSSIGLVILVNYGHARTRKRFSYAHEFAHALLDRKTTSAIVSRGENSQEFIERRANAFAAAFLMPKDGARWFFEEVLEKGGPSRRYRVTFSSAGERPSEAEERPIPGSQQVTYQDVVSFAHHFGVSYLAAVYRLSDLGFISYEEKPTFLAKSDLAARLLKAITETSDAEEEKEARQAKRKPDRELVSQIRRLAIEAYRRDEVTPGWLRDLSDKLEMSADDLLELAEAASH